MEKMIYVTLCENVSNDYVSVNKAFLEKDLQKQYNSLIEIYNDYNIENKPTLSQFEKGHIKIKVTYDGRKNIFKHDIMQALENEGYIRQVAAGGIFGGYYKKTDKLKVKTEMTDGRTLIAV